MDSKVLEKKNNLLDANLVRVIDILAQIKSLNDIIKLHKKENNDNFMSNQYQDMKNRFMKELEEVMLNYDITILNSNIDIKEQDTDSSELASEFAG